MSSIPANAPNTFLMNLGGENPMSLTDSEGYGFMDNFAWNSVTDFGKNARARYYYLQDPGEQQLYKTSRYTEWGWRIVWGVTGDIWNNNFSLNFIDLDDKEAAEKNALLEIHFKDIKLYQEARKATGFDREQGESILVIHREGEDYDTLMLPANTGATILRVEAINKVDYTIPQQKEFGTPIEYRIQFMREGMGAPVYHTHISHAVRFRTQNLDYDQYAGQSSLKPVFGSIQILLNLTRSAGDAAFRWGLGIPAIGAKKVRNTKDATELRNIIGNPTTQDWFIYPSEMIEKIEMLGLNGTMMDLPGLQDMVINNIVVKTTIPKAILIGDAVGVIEGSRVFERGYYALLDQNQTRLNEFIEAYIKLDPVALEIIGEAKFKINWGLRQVMTKMDEAEYKAVIFGNSMLMVGFATWNEVRANSELLPWEDVYKGMEKFHKDMYGFTPKELGILPATTVNLIIGASITAQNEKDNPKVDEKGNPIEPEKEEERDPTKQEIST